MTRLLPLVIVVACATEPRPATRADGADQRAYTRAAQGDADACEEISDPRLSGECLAFSARARAPADLADAQAACARIADPLWRDECRFLVCDAAEVSAADARHCCAGGGRYETRCIGHAVSREVYGVLERFPPGDEDSAWAAARQASVAALGPAGADRAADLFVRFIVDRTTESWLHTADCGTAPEALCADAYAELVKRVADSQERDPVAFVRSACARTVGVDRATDLGLPGWDPPLDAAVQAAFSRMCDR